MNWTSTVLRGAKRRTTPLASALAITLMAGLSSSATATSYNPLFGLSTALPKVVLANTLMASPVEGFTYYTIVFKEAPLATYGGEISSLRAPDHVVRNGVTSAKIDVNSAPALAYVSYLASKQQNFVDELSANLHRPIDVMARMQHALNAVIVRLSSAEASAVMKRADVMFIEAQHDLELQTDRGPAFIGAPSIWNGLTATGVATQGEGILFGDIDSGINWESPAFAVVGPIDAYVHQNPKGNGTYLGQCAPGGVDTGKCNDKLIGIYNFAAPGTTGTDIEGHGSHTASTVAGNRWNATFANGPFTISGVAPHANVIAYLACPTTSCPSTATSQSANQAVVDGVDVINYSISGGTSPWTDATSTAFRNAVAAGAFVAASAGNTSASVPNPQGQVNHMEPWVETVAASTEDRIIAVSLDLTSEAAPPANTQNIPMRPGAAPLPTQNLVDVPMIKSPNFANGSTDGCSAYPAGTFVRSGAPIDRIFADGFDGTPPPPIAQGAVAVLHLDGTASSCGSGARRTAALNAGAVGVIFVDTIYLNLGAANTSWSMLMSDWLNLESGSVPATATISIDIAAQSFPGIGDQIASFSFRGPRLVSGQGMVKPDITAPGVDILAVGASSLVGPNGVILLNGTSMSSPHMAGSAVLMRALNPTWSATQVKSALNMSSNNFGAINQDGSPVRLWDYGSGRVNLSTASKVGLIMDETSANFVAANPAIGGDISTLNLASMAKAGFVGDTVFTRTFRRARSGSQTYTLSATGFPAGSVEFSPASFTISSTGSRTITVTAHAALLPGATWTLGELTLTPSAGDEPNLHLPIALNPAGPIIQVTPTSISDSSDTTTSNNLTIANIGNPTLNWSVVNTGTAQVTPLNTTTSGSGQQDGYYSAVNEGYYWLQDFDIGGATHVTTLRANGFVFPSGTLTVANTPTITFSIYANNAGVPAGAPEGFGAAPVWTYTSTIGTAATTGITTTGGNIQLALSAPGVPSLDLPSGRFWMSVSPTMNTAGANPAWAWRTSPDAQVGNQPVLYAPFDDPGNFQVDPATINMSAFVQGTVSCVLPSWVNVTPSAGSLGLGASQIVPVVFDAAGLVAGTYTATLCIGSNATNAATVPVALSFTVPNGGAMPPTISKAFVPTSISAGSNSTLTITLNNAGPTASTLSANLLDTFPAGLVVAATPAAGTTCPAGVVTAAAGSGSVSLGSGAQIPAAGSCTVSVNVTSSTAAGYNNSIVANALQTNTGSNAAPANATLTVTAVAPTISKAFVPTSVSAGSNSTLTITLNNAGPTVSTLSANLLDTFPGGLVVAATPAAATTCPSGTVTAAAGSGSVSLGSGAQIPAAGSCTVSVDVTSSTAAGYNNTIAANALQTDTGSNAVSANATLTVTAVPPTISKAFVPTSVIVGSNSTLTITLNNAGPTVSTLSANLLDTFPAGLVVAATPAAGTTCPAGTVTAAAGSGSVSLGSGAQIPAAGNCTVSVNVTSSTAAGYNNTIAANALQTDTGSNAVSANATLTVLPLCLTGNAIEVTASAGTPGPTGYTTLKNAFDAINAGTHQGVLGVDVCADTTEAASAVLNASGSGAALYSAATIKPAGGASRTISGTLAAPLVDLNGADNVTIDGLNSGGNALTLSNASALSAAGSSTIRFIEGASNNVVTRTAILGSSTGTVAAATGNVLFSTSTIAGGNSNNTVSANTIGPAGSNLPTKGVTGLGTAGNVNSANVISGNDIADFFSPTLSVSGISIQANNNLWTISNNKLYQTAARTFTAIGLRYGGITLNASTGAFTVSNNVIGFGAANGTGTTTILGSTNTFRGIDAASTSTTALTSIQGNVISGINQTTASTGTGTGTNFIGIMAGSTDGLFDIGTVTGNSIGSLDGSTTIVVNSTAGTGNIIGIYNFSFFPTNIANNNIGSITIQGSATTNGFRGILINTAPTKLASVTNNTVANITDTLTGGSYSVYGIQTLLPPVAMSGNVVRNLTANTTGAATPAVAMSGISIGAGTSNAASVVSRNTVHSLMNTSTGANGGAIYAYDFTVPAQANVIERNLTHSINVVSTNTTYQIFGLLMRGATGSTSTVKNNMIRLGLDAAGASITTPFVIIGIRDSAATGVAHSYYHNSVYIGGTGVAAAGQNSFAFNSNTVTTTRNIQNNIFWNARSNAVGGGIGHAAIALAGTAPNPPGTVSNFNVLRADGTDGITGFYNAAAVATLTGWQTATGLDANSFATNPQFIAPNGNAVTGDLHISPVISTPVESTGLAIASATDDFDGQDRGTLTPTDIGADAGNFVP